MIKKRTIFIFFYFSLTTTLLQASSHETEPAYVRRGIDLCKEERNYIDLRRSRVKQALETLLKMPLADNEIPTIALCSSGGGYRAMLTTLGFIQGTLDQEKKRSIGSFLHGISKDVFNFFARYIIYFIGQKEEDTTLALTPLSDGTTLFDACTYCTCLSGSSWAVAGWLQSRKTVDDYLAHLAPSIEQNLLEKFNLDNIADALALKYLNDQPITLIDIYGCLLAQAFLSNLGIDNPNDFLLGSDIEYVTNASIPLPIHTGIIGEDMTEYEWVEFSPFEVGSIYQQAFIPTWSFNRRFDNGVSQELIPPSSLSFCLGMWGSAMCLNAQESLQLLQPHIENLEQTSGTAEKEVLETVDNAITLFLNTFATPEKTRFKNSLLDRRLSPARVCNWTYNLKDAPLNHLKTLEIVDAGIDFRIAVPPLLRPERNVDIIIILDNSDRALGTELHDAEKYAQLHGLKFPPIDYSIINQPYSVHQDPNDLSVPIVIYFPLLKNNNYCDGWDPWAADFTTVYNFTYTQEQSYLLAGLTRYSLNEGKPVILNTIRDWIERKRSSTSSR